MTAYHLNISTWTDRKHSSLWSTIEQCQAEAERIAGMKLEWGSFINRFPEASFTTTDGEYGAETTNYARITVTPEGVIDHGFQVGLRSWQGAIIENKEFAARYLGHSDGNTSGFLSEWIFIPKANKWVALYMDSNLGPEIATLTYVEVQGLIRET